MTRRKLLALCVSGLAGALAEACVQPAPVTPTPPPAPPPAPTATPTAATLQDVAPGTILSNEDTPGFYVRFITNFAALDPGRWRLVIKGLVEAPATMTLSDIQANLAYAEQSSRLKCVECWSHRSVWGGFRYDALAAVVKPQPQALYVRFTCEDGYFELLPISELRNERALFATHLDGRFLPAQHGAPLRMVLPWLYGYKGAKTITMMEFVAEPGEGYWPTFGPYSAEGRILPGIDTPLDLGFKARPITGGEITDY